MTKMENNIDKLFREGLADHREDPPAHLWNNIAEVAFNAPQAANGKKNFLYTGKRWWVIGLLMVTLLSGIAILRHNPETSDPLLPQESLTKRVSSPSIAAPVAPSISHQNLSPGSSNTTTPVVHPLALTAFPIEKIQPETPSTESTPYIKEELPITSEIPSQVTEDIASGSFVEENANSPPAIIISLEIPTTQNIENLDTSNVPNAKTALHDTAAVKSQPTSEKTKDLMVSAPAVFGMQYGFSWYAGPLLYQAMIHDKSLLRPGAEGGMNVHLRYHRAHFQTGWGITWYLDKDPWSARVIQTDTTGYYPYVTGVTFVPVYNPIDSSIVGYTPDQVNTVSKPAIDTTILHVNAEASTRYTYLHFPLIAGYDVLYRGDLSLRVEAGLIYSLSMYEHKVPPTVPGEPVPGSMINHALVRKEQFWQYHAGLGLWYDFSPQWHAGGQVAIRKPLQRLYQQSSGNDKPLTLTINAGIGFWF